MRRPRRPGGRCAWRRARQDPGPVAADVPALAPVSLPRARRRRDDGGRRPAHHRRHRAPCAPSSRRAAEEPRPAPKKDDGPGFIRLSEGDFKLPGADLLEYVPPPAQEIDKQGLYDMAARLEQAMSNYGVKGNVSAINMGPVVTMYEFAPAPGTRTGKIAKLANDLAMALEAQAVRIVAPIPGKAVVGVEVPNKTRADGLPEGDPRRRRLPRRRREAADRARQGHRGHPGQRRTWPRCPTCWSPAPPARASRSPSTG